jgi:hypothetical protein
LWELVEKLLQDSSEAFMLVDDSVQDKRYSQFIELVKLQYSGAEHGLVRGIGIVNLVHSAGTNSKISIQLIIVFMHLTKTARPKTNIFRKWLSTPCMPRKSRQNISCSIVGMLPPKI